MLTPSKWLWVWPLMRDGGSTPSRSRTVGTMSTAWWYCSRIWPAAALFAGQLMMHGSAVPPLNS